jgi:hypothetical protein
MEILGICNLNEDINKGMKMKEWLILISPKILSP